MDGVRIAESTLLFTSNIWDSPSFRPLISSILLLRFRSKECASIWLSPTRIHTSLLSGSLYSVAMEMRSWCCHSCRGLAGTACRDVVLLCDDAAVPSLVSVALSKVVLLLSSASIVAGCLLLDV